VLCKHTQHLYIFKYFFGFYLRKNQEKITMAIWLKVAKVEEFTGNVQCVEHDGIRIAVFKLNDGFYAINDECSHDEASLSEGEIIKDCIIECPLHGAQFDIKTGKNLAFPAVTPVDAYPVKIEDGEIYVQVEE
jgi:nitrite reductase/ring-hydroxylating ferredoxin subunit